MIAQLTAILMFYGQKMFLILLNLSSFPVCHLKIKNKQRKVHNMTPVWHKVEWETFPGWESFLLRKHTVTRSSFQSRRSVCRIWPLCGSFRLKFYLVKLQMYQLICHFCAESIDNKRAALNGTNFAAWVFIKTVSQY